MTRLNEQEANKIIFNAQVASYPSNDVPLLLKPLYEYVESVEAEVERLQAENVTLKRALELMCGVALRSVNIHPSWFTVDYFIQKAKEESENE